eukprot:CAMPEP_0115062760 /NCGR_PEP_ID=MMETSP0227-20121206/8724_1 /TAXON_ID=89957 /ORGANISM="Polarella glacialis, Strain CCMP 1383" /LENGTH=217 /DNA_ID=CAMNT_0002448173 /DNA_START=385 /DNA_END=1038 /DNA_ORIENTATION=-
MDEFFPPAEPRCIVRPILRVDSCDVVFHEILVVVWVSLLHQEEFPDCHGTERQHGGAQLLKSCVPQKSCPKMDAIQQVEFLRCGLLVLAIGTRDNPPTPGVQVEPIEGAKQGEVDIFGAGVGGVPHQGLHIGHEGVVGSESWLQLQQNSRRNHEVTEMVVVVVIAGVAKISAAEASIIMEAFLARDSAPVTVVVAADWSSSAISGMLAIIQALEARR